MVRDDIRYYTHSGKFSGTGLLVVLILIPVGTALLGLIYGYVSVYWPFSWFNVLSCLLYAAGCGIFISTAGYTAHIRNVALMRWLGSLTGLFAWYFGWAFWFYAWSDEHLFPRDPRDLADWLPELAAKGSWTALWVTPKGIALYLIWIIEAGIIFYIINWLSTASMENSVYCEHCADWTETEVLEPRLEALADDQPLVKALEEGRFELLKHLKPVGEKWSLALQFQLDSCKSCQQSHYLTVQELTNAPNQNGEEAISATDLMRFFHLKPAQASELSDSMSAAKLTSDAQDAATEQQQDSPQS